MYDEGSDFCIIHVHWQPFDPWKYEKTPLAYEDYKVKYNCEEDDLTSIFSFDDQKTIAMEEDAINGDEGPFGSDPKEENKSELESP